MIQLKRKPPSLLWAVLCVTALCAPELNGQGKAASAGAMVFASAGCVHCHGAAGEGTDSGPSLREVRRKMKAAQIGHQIVAGGGEMPAFGTSLNPEQVKDLVSFLRAKTWVEAPATAKP